MLNKPYAEKQSNNTPIAQNWAVVFQLQLDNAGFTANRSSAEVEVYNSSGVDWRTAIVTKNRITMQRDEHHLSENKLLNKTVLHSSHALNNYL